MGNSANSKDEKPAHLLCANKNFPNSLNIRVLYGDILTYPSNCFLLSSETLLSSNVSSDFKHIADEMRQISLDQYAGSMPNVLQRHTRVDGIEVQVFVLYLPKHCSDTIEVINETLDRILTDKYKVVVIDPLIGSGTQYGCDVIAKHIAHHLFSLRKDELLPPTPVSDYDELPEHNSFSHSKYDENSLDEENNRHVKMVYASPSQESVWKEVEKAEVEERNEVDISFRVVCRWMCHAKMYTKCIFRIHVSKKMKVIDLRHSKIRI